MRQPTLCSWKRSTWRRHYFCNGLWDSDVSCNSSFFY